MKDKKQDEIIFPDDAVIEAVKNCVAQLIINDLNLLESDLNERTISSQLARYLQACFGEWHVDCEYNRNHDDPKRLKIYPQRILREEFYRDTLGRSVFPDIIVHRRGEESNFIVMEIKKTTSSVGKEFDIMKLREFKRQLGYQYALFLEIGTRDSAGSYELSSVNSRGGIVCHQGTEYQQQGFMS